MCGEWTKENKDRGKITIQVAFVIIQKKVSGLDEGRSRSGKGGWGLYIG